MRKYFLSLLFIFSLNSTASEQYTFLRSFIDKPANVGSVVPSSIALATELSKYLMVFSQPIHVLEVGAGTGTITERILKQLPSGSQLDVIEIEPKLCKILQKKFGRITNIKIHCTSILSWRPSYNYDVVISELPFNSFDVSLVESILDLYKTLLKPEGILSYFEYIALGNIKTFFLQGQKKEDFLKVKELLEKFRKNFEFETIHVLANIPPAYVHHLKIK